MLIAKANITCKRFEFLIYLGYQTVMPPPSPAQQMMFSRPNRPPSNTQTSAQPNPLLNYPNVGKPTQSQQPQTPSGIGTPPIPQQVKLAYIKRIARF
jgi:hypothetical protein